LGAIKTKNLHITLIQSGFVPAQRGIKAVVPIIARSVLCDSIPFGDEAIPKRLILPDKSEIAYPSGTLRGRQKTARNDKHNSFDARVNSYRAKKKTSEA
jgi:hypothetical protein